MSTRTELSDSELQALRERAEAATHEKFIVPEPDKAVHGEPLVRLTRVGTALGSYVQVTPFLVADVPLAEHIASANPATVLALCDEVAAARAEVAALKEALSGFIRPHGHTTVCYHYGRGEVGQCTPECAAARAALEAHPDGPRAAEGLEEMRTEGG